MNEKTPNYQESDLFVSKPDNGFKIDDMQQHAIGRHSVTNIKVSAANLLLRNWSG